VQLLSKSVVAEPETSIPPDEIRAELQAILASKTFERAERLRRFLSYVCELTLRGEAARINEYLIGAEVFERGSSYSPNEDSVVRRQAHALRHKLQEYYAEDGRDALVRIELPVGKYVPIFRRAQGAIPVPAAPPEKSGRRGTLAALLLGLIPAIFLAGWAVGRRSSDQELPPRFPRAVTQIWSPWFQDPNGAVLCFSNPLTTVVKQFEKEVLPNSAPGRFRAEPKTAAALRQFLNLPPGGHLYMTPTLAQGKMGEAMSAVSLAGLLGQAGVPVRATQSRFLSWEDLRRLNLILLGNNEANTWLDPLLNKYPLRLAATDGERPRHIDVLQPRPEEPREFHIEFSNGRNEPTHEYALVSMIPGIDGRRKLLLINGLNTQATQMAAEYLTTPATLEDLLGRLQGASPDHRGPWHFQIVLRTEVRDKVPTRASVVALRVL
jgi:hypothetical protein